MNIGGEKVDTTKIMKVMKKVTMNRYEAEAGAIKIAAVVMPPMKAVSMHRMNIDITKSLIDPETMTWMMNLIDIIDDTTNIKRNITENVIVTVALPSTIDEVVVKVVKI